MADKNPKDLSDLATNHVRVKLPNGSYIDRPLANFNQNVNVTYVVVADGQMMEPPVAVTYLSMQRDWWQEKALDLESKLGDALSRLQEIEG